jgi:hypothetical protein
MRKSNIALLLSKLNPVGVLALMRNVWAKMTGNRNFPTPAVPLADFEREADALEQAIEAATFGSRQSKLQRDQQVRVCGDMLTAQADYVRSVCNGDEAMLESSGFRLARPRVPLPPPSAPDKLSVERSTVEGVLKVRWSSVRGARLYYLEMLEEGATEWKRILSTTKVKYEATGLTTGSEYSFRVQTVSAQGVSPMSEVVSQKAA